MSINKVVLSGNLTRDMELRQTANGFSVGSFGMAVNDRRKNPQTGEWEDYPNFVDVTLFGNRATALQQHLVKGAKIALEGKLRYQSWERDGQKRSKLEVVADEIELMAPRQQQYGQQPYQPQQQYGQQPYQPQQQYGQRQPQPPMQQQARPAASVYDEDIPF